MKCDGCEGEMEPMAFNRHACHRCNKIINANRVCHACGEDMIQPEGKSYWRCPDWHKQPEGDPRLMVQAIIADPEALKMLANAIDRHEFQRSKAGIAANRRERLEKVLADAKAGHLEALPPTSTNAALFTDAVVDYATRSSEKFREDAALADHVRKLKPGQFIGAAGFDGEELQVPHGTACIGMIAAGKISGYLASYPIFERKFTPLYRESDGSVWMEVDPSAPATEEPKIEFRKYT